MRQYFLTLTLFALVFPSVGQTIDLSYNEAIEIALEQNVQLNTQKNDMRYVKAQKSQSVAEIAPNISAYTNGFQANGNTFLEQYGEVINQTSNNLQMGFEARMNIFNGLMRINDIKRTGSAFEAQKHMIQRTRQDIVFQASNDFLQVLLDEELLNIAKDNVKTQEVLMMQIEAMVEAGTKPKSDFYDQQAIVKQMELLTIRAKNNLSNDEANLAITLQLDPRTDFTLLRPNWDVQDIMLLDYNLNELYNLALNSRQDLKQFQYTESELKYSTAMAKSFFVPSLGAYYNWGTRYNSVAASDEVQNPRNLSQQLWQDNKGMSYGLYLNIPIFSGLRNRTQYVNYKILQENANLNTENLEKTILIDVKNAYQNFLDVKAGYEVSLAQLEAAEVALNVQQEKYKLGVGNLIELTNANNNHIQAMANKAQAEVNLMFQKIILDYYTGTLEVPNES